MKLDRTEKIKYSKASTVQTPDSSANAVIQIAHKSICT